MLESSHQAFSAMFMTDLQQSWFVDDFHIFLAILSLSKTMLGEHH